MSELPVAGQIGQAVPSVTRINRWSAIRRIAQQEIRDAMVGWTVYLTAAAGLLVAALLIYSSLQAVAGSGLDVLPRPFLGPAAAAAALAIVFVTVGATLAIARPREQGALRVLFFAPVDTVALLGGHFMAGIGLYGVVVVMLMSALAVMAFMTNLVLPVALLWGLALSVLAAGVAVAFGLFLSAIAPSSRGAVLFLLATVALLLAVQGGHAALLSVPPTGRYYDALLFLREVLRSASDLLLWVSPIGMLERSLDAALRADLQTMAAVSAGALVTAALWLSLAVLAVRRRGVLP
jgi:ABC-type transport system involved in multi-copper enzyme maturation permease subunit